MEVRQKGRGYALPQAVLVSMENGRPYCDSERNAPGGQVVPHLYITHHDRSSIRKANVWRRRDCFWGEGD